MDLLTSLSSSPDLANAILIALAKHPDAQVKDLVSGYTDAEIGAMALSTPVLLQIVVRMVIDKALGEPESLEGARNSLKSKALAKQLEQAISAKKELNDSLAGY